MSSAFVVGIDLLVTVLAIATTAVTLRDAIRDGFWGAPVLALLMWPFVFFAWALTPALCSAA